MPGYTYYGKGLVKLGKVPVCPEARKRSRELVARMTRAEQLMGKLLYEAGARFKFQEVFQFPDHYYIADFWIKSLRLIIELDGEHHYSNMGQEYRDTQRTEQLEKHGLGFIKILRVPNHMLERKTFRDEFNNFLVRRKASMYQFGRYLAKLRRKTQPLKQAGKLEGIVGDINAE